MVRSRITAPAVAGLGLALLITLAGTRLGASVPSRNLPSDRTTCAGTVWASNGSERTVTIIDETDNTVVHTTNATDYPRTLTFSSDGRVAALTTWNFSHDTVHILDGATGVESTQFEIGTGDVTSAAISSDGSKVFVAKNSGGGTIEAWSIASASIITGPSSTTTSYDWGMVVGPSDVYLTEWDGSTYGIERYDAATLAHVEAVTPPTAQAYFGGYSLTGDGSTLWWIDEVTKLVYRYDAASQTSTMVFDASSISANYLNVSRDGLWLSLFSQSSIILANTQTLTVSTPITTNFVNYGYLTSGGFTPDNAHLYLVYFAYANTVLVDIDMNTAAVTSSMTGGQTNSVTVCPVGFEPEPTTTTTEPTTLAAPDPVVPKVTG